MKIESGIAKSAVLVALFVPLVAGISACGEDNPARNAIESQKQQLQEQANEAFDQQTKEARQRAQDALNQAKGKANEAIDQAQQQTNDALPPVPSP